MDEKVIETIRDIEGISIADGLTYCGSVAAYAKFINSFYNSIEQKAADIENAYENEDFELYTMKVHSLKSTARIAGMPELSELALSLEDAGRTGNIDFIRENNARLIKLYKGYKDKLAVLDELKKEEDAKLTPISESDLRDVYSALSDSIGAEDYDSTELILKEAMNYRLPEDDKAVMSKLEKLMKNLNWEEMAEVIKRQ